MSNVSREWYWDFTIFLRITARLALLNPPSNLPCTRSMVHIGWSDRRFFRSSTQPGYKGYRISKHRFTQPPVRSRRSCLCWILDSHAVASCQTGVCKTEIIHLPAAWSRHCLHPNLCTYRWKGLTGLPNTYQKHQSWFQFQHRSQQIRNTLWSRSSEDLKKTQITNIQMKTGTYSTGYEQLTTITCIPTTTMKSSQTPSFNSPDFITLQKSVLQQDRVLAWHSIMWHTSQVVPSISNITTPLPTSRNTLLTQSCKPYPKLYLPAIPQPFVIQMYLTRFCDLYKRLKSYKTSTSKLQTKKLKKDLWLPV
jgi:hypothetical protein